MPSVLQESSQSSFQSSKSSSSQGMQELAPSKWQVDKSDSVQDMLQEMSELNKKMLEKYFKGDKESMTEHYKKALDSTISDDFGSLQSKRLKLRKEDSLEDYQETAERVEVKVDLQDYKPHEVVIRTADNEISIEAKHEEDGKTQSSRHFSRKITLPSNVIFDKISCTLNSKGTLTVVAPRNPAEASSKDANEKVQKSSTTSESKQITDSGGHVYSKTESHREERVSKHQESLPQIEEHGARKEKTLLKQDRVCSQQGSGLEQMSSSIRKEEQQQKSGLEQMSSSIRKEEQQQRSGLEQMSSSIRKEEQHQEEQKKLQETQSRKNVDSLASRMEERMNLFGKEDAMGTRDPIKEMMGRMKERHQRLLERHFKGDSDEMFSEYHQFLNKHFSDDPFLPYYTRSISRFQNEEPKVIENEKEFEINLNVSQFKPDEINVKTLNNCLEIEAKHAESDGFITKHLRRKYTLPSDTQADQISSKLSPEGALVIKIPKVQRRTDIERVVPVQTIQV